MPETWCLSERGKKGAKDMASSMVPLVLSVMTLGWVPVESGVERKWTGSCKYWRKGREASLWGQLWGQPWAPIPFAPRPHRNTRVLRSILLGKSWRSLPEQHILPSALAARLRDCLQGRKRWSLTLKGGTTAARTDVGRDCATSAPELFCMANRTRFVHVLTRARGAIEVAGSRRG